MSCATALASVLRWHPDAVAWFDYTAWPHPSLVIAAAADLGTVIVDAAEPALEALDIRARPDLVPAGVVVLFERATEPDDDGRVWEYVTEQVYPGGTTIDTPRVIVVTCDYTGYGDGDQRTPPAGVAQLYYQSLAALQHEGSLTLHADAIDARQWLGRNVSITGDLPEYASMRAQVQEVTEDIDSGRTVVRFGLPRHLRPSELVELLEFRRNRRKGFSTRKTSSQMAGMLNTFVPLSPGQQGGGGLPEGYAEEELTIAGDSGAETRYILTRIPE